MFVAPIAGVTVTIMTSAGKKVHKTGLEQLETASGHK